MKFYILNIALFLLQLLKYDVPSKLKLLSHPKMSKWHVHDNGLYALGLPVV